MGRLTVERIPAHATVAQRGDDGIQQRAHLGRNPEGSPVLKVPLEKTARSIVGLLPEALPVRTENARGQTVYVPLKTCRPEG
jgi:hypothetical protein